MPPRILVLYNEPVLPADHPDAKSEHDVLDTAANTARVLAAAGFEVDQLGIHYDPRPLLDHLRDRPPAAVFNLFEGLATQTGTEVSVAGLLEWLNVPFTGSPAAAMALGRDKVRTKHLLAAAGLPTPDYLVVDRLPAPEWPGPWPAIVKPALQDASVGIDQASVVTTPAQLAERTRYVLDTYGPPVLVERFLTGREFHVNVIEEGPPGARVPRLVPLAEIGFEHTNPDHWPIYSFAAKWHTDSEEWDCTPLYSPVELPGDAMDRLRGLAERAFGLLLLRDYGRLDVRMDAAGGFHILEVNPNPFLNSAALVRGLRAMGRSHEQVVVDIALAAVARGGTAVPDGEIRAPEGVSLV